MVDWDDTQARLDQFDPAPQPMRPFVEGEEVEVTLTIECRVKGRMVNVSADGEHADLEAETFTADTQYAIIGTVIHRRED